MSTIRLKLVTNRLERRIDLVPVNESARALILAQPTLFTEALSAAHEQFLAGGQKWVFDERSVNALRAFLLDFFAREWSWKGFGPETFEIHSVESRDPLR
jgi:hypothetical protein